MKVLRKNTLSFKLVLSYIIIGFISSFIFYSLSQFQYYAFDQSEINTEPLMYLVFCFILLIVPFAFLEVKSIQYIDDSHIFQYLKYIGILLGILSLAPFLDGIMKLSSLNYSAIKDAYEGNDSSNTNIIVYYSVQLRNYLKFFIAPLFFYFLYKGEKCKLQFYFVVFALLTTILLSLLGGGRGTMVNECNYMVICYLIFKELLTEEKIKKLKKIGTSACLAVVISLTIITLARFDFSSKNSSKEENLDLITWVSLYLGQGPLEFSRQMYDSKVRTEGDNSFSLIKTIFGQKTFKDNNDRREYWESKQSIQNFIFYTVVGDIYSDLGAFHTICFLAILSMIIAMYFKKNSKRVITIQSIIIISIYFEWVSMGFMCNCYKTYYSQFFILFTLIILSFFSFIQSNKNKKNA